VASVAMVTATDIRSKFCCVCRTGRLISDLRHRLGVEAGSLEPSPARTESSGDARNPEVPKDVKHERMEARKPGFVKSSYPYFQIARDTGCVI
jgi:hypothetical protein